MLATDDATVTIEQFDPEARAQAIEKLFKKTTSKKNASSTMLTTSSPDNNDQGEDISPLSVATSSIIKSSLSDLALLVKAETGKTVQFGPDTRPIEGDTLSSTTPDNVATQPTKPQSTVDSRIVARMDTIDTYRDSDHDGISDYDEVHLYGTDPYNAYTSGSKLTDGERLALGLDLHSTSSDPIPVQSPKVAGPTVSNIFTLDSMQTVSLPPAPVASSTSTSTKSSSTSTPLQPIQPTTGIAFSGHALPNSFVTLYIFSTPIVVTVKTDTSGVWHYTLTKELEDGQHQAYVAMVDASGKIVAKSPAIPFTKRAEALDYTPLQIPTVEPVSFSQILKDNMVAISAVAFLLFGLLAIAILGLRASRSIPPIPPAPTPSV